MTLEELNDWEEEFIDLLGRTNLADSHKMNAIYEHKRVLELSRSAIKLKAFKDYVHKRLDEIGVPYDPDPVGNESHGCRIEGRLNWLIEKAQI